MASDLHTLARALDLGSADEAAWLGSLHDALRPLCKHPLVMVQRSGGGSAAPESVLTDATKLADCVATTNAMFPQVATAASSHIVYAGALSGMIGQVAPDERRDLFEALANWNFSGFEGFLASSGESGSRVTASILWPVGHGSVHAGALRSVLPHLWAAIGRSELTRRQRLAAPSPDHAEPPRGPSLWDELIHGQALVHERSGERGDATWLVETHGPTGAPIRRSTRQLSVRESFLVDGVSRGASNKELGYHLGVTNGTIGSVLTRAMRKLEVRNRAELCALAAGARGMVADDRGGLAHVSTASLVSSSGGLRESQRRLLTHLTRGLTNRDIATTEGLSQHTVRNRIATLMRRFAVHSRSELIGRAHPYLSDADTG